MDNVNITVRISKRLKEELKKYGIRVSEVVRRALEEEVEKRRVEELENAAEKLGEFFSKIGEEEVVKSIKEARRSR